MRRATRTGAKSASRPPRAVPEVPPLAILPVTGLLEQCPRLPPLVPEAHHRSSSIPSSSAPCRLELRHLLDGRTQASICRQTMMPGPWTTPASSCAAYVRTRSRQVAPTTCAGHIALAALTTTRTRCGHRDLSEASDGPARVGSRGKANREQTVGPRKQAPMKRCMSQGRAAVNDRGLLIVFHGRRSLVVSCPASPKLSEHPGYVRACQKLSEHPGHVRLTLPTASATSCGAHAHGVIT
jgi:hypothetical protein